MNYPAAKLRGSLRQNKNMDILPLKSIREEDGPLVGANLVLLSRLKQLDFPVPDGLVVIPPKLEFNTILSHYELKSADIFEQKLILLRKDIYKIKPPTDLDNRHFSTNKLWQKILEIWLAELRSKLWREGFSQDLTGCLSAQPIFFSGKIISFGESYFNYVASELSLKVIQGSLNEEQTNHLEEVIKKANQKLFLPFLYDWILDSTIKLVKIRPFTQNIERGNLETIFYNHFAKTPFFQNGDEGEERLKLPRQMERSGLSLKYKKTADFQSAEAYNQQSRATNQLKSSKSAFKIFLQLEDDFRIDQQVNGIVIISSKDFDQTLLKLVESATTIFPNPVIFKLEQDCLFLIHSHESLKQEVEKLKFVRNKKALKNVSLAIPLTRSVNEFNRLKEKLVGLGVSRKGSLNFWWEIAIPENILNLNDYLKSGLDGVILNLDSLATLLGGFSLAGEEKIFYQSQIEGLLKYLEEPIKLLQKNQVPILVCGDLAQNDEVLKFLLSKGILGIIVNTASMGEYVSFLEKQHIKHLSS